MLFRTTMIPQEGSVYPSLNGRPVFALIRYTHKMLFRIFLGILTINNQKSHPAFRSDGFIFSASLMTTIFESLDFIQGA